MERRRSAPGGQFKFLMWVAAGRVKLQHQPRASGTKRWALGALNMGSNSHRQ